MIGLGGGITQLAQVRVPEEEDNLAAARLKGGVFGNRDCGARADATTRKRRRRPSRRRGRSSARQAAARGVREGRHAQQGGRLRRSASSRCTRARCRATGSPATGTETSTPSTAAAAHSRYSQILQRRDRQQHDLGQFARRRPARTTRGSALFADSVELTSSTVTGNTGAAGIVVIQVLAAPLLPTGKAGKRKAPPALPRGSNAKARVSTLRQESRTQGRPRRHQGGGPADLRQLDRRPATRAASTSICFECTIGGSNNLIRLRTRPPRSRRTRSRARIAALAPLANNGGVIAGAPGHVLHGAQPYAPPVHHQPGGRRGQRLRRIRVRSARDARSLASPAARPTSARSKARSRRPPPGHRRPIRPTRSRRSVRGSSRCFPRCWARSGSRADDGRPDRMKSGPACRPVSFRRCAMLQRPMRAL